MKNERQPSNTPYTRGWPLPKLRCDICGEKYFSQRMLNKHYDEGCIPRRNWFRQFAFWGFIKYKWQALDEVDRKLYTLIGEMFGIIFWVSFIILMTKVHSVFVIPAIITFQIGVVAVVMIIKHLIKSIWNKYLPEYQDFKQGHKSKHPAGKMATFEELFEGYEDVPLPPDPRITPTTVRGNYPRKVKQNEYP